MVVRDLPWKDVINHTAKFGGGWLLAVYLVYSLLTDIKPSIASVAAQMQSHTLQTGELRASIDRLIQVTRAACVNAARTDTQRERCSQ